MTHAPHKITVPFVPFHTSLLQAYSDHHFTGRQSALLMQLVRRLLGFHKEVDVIASSQLEAWTGIDAGNVRRTLAELEALKVIDRKRVKSPSGHGFSYEIRLVKDVTQWKVAHRRKKPLTGGDAEHDFLFPQTPRASDQTPPHHSTMDVDAEELAVPQRYVDAGNAPDASVFERPSDAMMPSPGDCRLPDEPNREQAFEPVSESVSAALTERLLAEERRWEEQGIDF